MLSKDRQIEFVSQFNNELYSAYSIDIQTETMRNDISMMALKIIINILKKNAVLKYSRMMDEVDS